MLNLYLVEQVELTSYVKDLQKRKAVALKYSIQTG